MSARATLGPNWSMTGHYRRDVTNGRTLKVGGGVVYQDECVYLSAEVGRRFITPERDIGEGTSFNFTIRLKHLG